MMPLAKSAKISNGCSGVFARSSLFAALLACGAASGCTPYAYTDDVGKLNTQMTAIETSYKSADKMIADETRMKTREDWICHRPLLVFSGCDGSSTANSTETCRLIIQTKGSRADDAKKARVDKPAVEDAGVKTVTPAKDVCDAVVDGSELKAQKVDSAKPAIDQIKAINALKGYFEGLAAVTKAQDRADFNTAATKLGGAVKELVNLASSGNGSLAGAAFNLAAWLIGQDLDYQRLLKLQEATRLACRPVKEVLGALSIGIEDQRGERLSELSALVIVRTEALGRARARHVTDQDYGAAIDQAQAAVDAYEKVRTSKPKEAVDKLREAHDKLVEAVKNNNGQFEALAKSLADLAPLVSGLVTASTTSAK
jgi:hypothetical protein